MEKAFNSVNNLILITVLAKRGFYQMDINSNAKLRILCY